MSRYRSTYADLVGGCLALMAALAPARASGQACCAGAGALTPARLGLHEDWLVGTRFRVASIVGNFRPDGQYDAAPPGAHEVDVQQELFGAIRLLQRGQVALLVPLVETYRSSGGRSEVGGGLGDANLAVRYDVYPAGRSRYVPGLGLLGGLTLPTGTAAESASKPLATDATGRGATQGSLGLALEQVHGAWWAGVSGYVAVRARRTIRGLHSALAPQLSGLCALGRVFKSGASVTAAVMYTAEGDSTVNGERVAQSARHLMTWSFAGQVPLDDASRLLGSLFFEPPISSMGANQPASVGGTLGVTWSML